MKMLTKQPFRRLTGFSILMILAVTNSLYSQVTVGSDVPPQNFSVLELIGDGTKGLRLPQMSTANRDKMVAVPEFVAEKTGKALGLQIFNTTTRCVNTWNGTTWIEECPPEGPHIQPVSIAPPASCMTQTAGSNGSRILTAVADPNAEAYEFFLAGVSMGEQTENSITFSAAQTGTVTVAYLFPPAYLKPKMIDVVGGTFTMGAAVQASLDGAAGNGPVGGTPLVTLTGFKMSETPITQAQYAAVIKSNPAVFQCSTNKNYAPSSAKPVGRVSWYDAIAFCNKLSILEGKTPCYTVNGVSDWSSLATSDIPAVANSDWDAAACNWTANGYRLPTEAEWEYAARGGQESETLSGRNTADFYYSGSNTANDVAWYEGNNGADNTATYGTKPVKTKVANALGLYDMSGNLYEWCWDWYTGSYTSGTDPKGPATGTYRILRGGDWRNPANYSRVSNRVFNTFPFNRNSGDSFRIVCSQ